MPEVSESIEATAEAVVETTEKASEVMETVITNTPTENIFENAAEELMETNSPFINFFKSFFTWESFFKILGVVILILILYFLYKLTVKGIRKAKFQKLDDHKKEILIRFIKYLLYTIVVIQILGLFGINFSALWGAAGIAGVAIGFAAQTSVSNIISGLFVITEGSLKLGDLIEVDGIKGYVDSINLLSVRVHTNDNQMVRIPNSTVIDSNLKNISYHKTRRLVIGVSVSYDTDMRKALDILITAPNLCSTVLKDPEPGAWYTGFGDSGINMELAVWFHEENFRQTKNDIFIAIKKVFDDASIEIPFNRLEVTIKE